MKAIQLITIGILFFVLLSCKKENDCETWEVDDSCTETGTCYYVGCNSYPAGIHQELICGDNLKDARPNNSITINGSCTSRKRIFIRKL
ncbi:hypothetical protein BH09BAC2_BH09BAC2_10560 [soil metagenome]